MSQDEFDFDERSEQQENLERVSARIAPVVFSFCSDHLRDGTNPQFYGEDLRKHVVSETGISAPGSADRILRDLRQRGMLGYRVLNRRQSFYEVTWVKGHNKPKGEAA